jgi:FKBP-type peptidyl-prolyl cis-trans isomerase (trigger factor)
MMTVTVEQVYQEALELPDEFKVSLTERLVAYLENHVDSQIEQQHLKAVHERRRQLLAGEVEYINGPEVLEQARQRLSQ